VFVIDKNQKARKWGRSLNIFQTLGGEVTIPLWTSGKSQESERARDGSHAHHPLWMTEPLLLTLPYRICSPILYSRSRDAFERATTALCATTYPNDDRSKGLEPCETCSVEPIGHGHGSGFS
jgi:hypothetical protein